jgi:TolB-like protein
MAETERLVTSYRFGVYEADLRARELRRRGIRIRLQEKPFQILEALLARPGELVTRTELRQKLWPDTFVGFDRSLNTAANTLRRALEDAPSNPRFLETRNGQGYKFIPRVESIAPRSARRVKDLGVVDSIAVLPFENSSGNPEMEYLSDGITETLIDMLGQVPEIRVMARATVFRYKGRQVDTQTIGQDLDVRALLTGKVSLRNDALIVSAELVDTLRGWRLWGEQTIGHFQIYSRSRTKSPGRSAGNFGYAWQPKQARGSRSITHRTQRLTRATCVAGIIGIKPRQQKWARESVISNEPSARTRTSRFHT